MRSVSSKGGRGVFQVKWRAKLEFQVLFGPWEELVSDAIQYILPRHVSGHFPILVDGGRWFKKGPSPFRFENMWLKEVGFKDNVHH